MATTGKVIALIKGLAALNGSAASFTTVSGTTMTASTALIVGTADTSGVRLDLESGNLAVREGDDSGYAPLIVAAGTVSVPGVAFGDANTGWYSTGSGSILAALDGTALWQVNGNSQFNYGRQLLGCAQAISAVTSDGTEDNSAATTNTSGATHSNRGASGTVTRTLPASPATGEIRRYIRIANQAFRVDPGATNAFLRADGTTTTGGKYIELQSNGAMIEIHWDGTNWVCMIERGTLAMEP